MSWPWTALAYEAGLCSTHLTLSRDYSGGPSINGASLVKVGLATEATAACTDGVHGKVRWNSTAGIVHGQDHGKYAGRVRWKSTLEEYMVARENAQGPSMQCMSAFKPRRRCCGLQVSGRRRRILGYFHKLSFVCLQADICDISSFSMLSQILWRI